MKLAIIGLGMAAKPHLEALEQLKDRVEISGFLTRSTDKSTKAAATYGGRAFANVDEIAADPDIDAAIILTPPNARIELVQMLATAGKHILMEKPVERTLSAAIELVDICEAAHIHLGIVLQHRFRSTSQKLAQLIADGALGEIAMVRITVPWWRDQNYYDTPGRGTYEQDGGGVLLTQAIHILDLALTLLEPVHSVQAMLATTKRHNMETEDFASAGFTLKNGAVGAIMATTASFPGGAECIEIDASKGAIKLQAGVLTVNWHNDSCEIFGQSTKTGGGADPMAFSCQWHREVIANFADTLEGKATLEASGRSAIKVHALIDAMERSHALNGQRVML